MLDTLTQTVDTPQSTVPAIPVEHQLTNEPEHYITSRNLDLIADEFQAHIQRLETIPGYTGGFSDAQAVLRSKMILHDPVTLQVLENAFDYSADVRDFIDTVKSKITVVE